MVAEWSLKFKRKKQILSQEIEQKKTTASTNKLSWTIVMSALGTRENRFFIQAQKHKWLCVATPPPQQYSPRYTIMHSKGVKLLRVSLSSSYHLPLKVVRSGLVQSNDFKTFLKIFEVVCSQNFVCNLELSFSNIFSKKSHENCMFLWFFYAKIIFRIYFTRKMTISRFLRACSLHDVIVTSYIIGWYLFWYQWKEGVHNYTPVVNLGLFDIPYW